MSKMNEKYRSSGNLPFLHAAVMIVLGFGLLLAGCGDLSLNMLLENEEPGVLRASPGVAAVPTASIVIIKGQGGFKPYTYKMESGFGSFDETAGVYTAPGFPTSARFLVTDGFGQTDRSRIDVVAPLKLKVNDEDLAQITVIDTDPGAGFTVGPVAFDADGGKMPPGSKYRYFLDEAPVDPLEVNFAGEWTFIPPAAGRYQVVVCDDLDNSDLVTVTVISVVTGGDLAISPTETQVEQGQTVLFTPINVQGTAVYSATDGSFNPLDPNEYIAPSPFTGTVTVTLTDSATEDSVAATVHVLGVDPGDLELVLSPSSAELANGDELVFSVSGGIPPYKFWLRPGSKGELQKVGETEALYKAPLSGNANDEVSVKDDVGTPPVSARVRVKK
jgi:plastocyanin